MRLNEHKKRKAAVDKSLALSCHTCQKEIPQGVSKSAEGKDYIWHFCDKRCYQRWQKEHPDKEE